MKRFFFFIFFPVFLFQSSFAQLPDGFIRERVASGLNPTSLAQTPDGRIFITEKHGSVLVIRDHVMLDDRFVTIEVDNSNERGLNHIVFHPEFESNGYFYLHYSVPGKSFNRISRFTANGDKAIPGSEVIMIELDKMGADIHNGGAMAFGFDGFLYIGTGDGAESTLAADPGSTNGKILRLDENGQPVPDNPWFNSNVGRSKTVYATGLRNPFTMAIHPLTGDIYVNDVGGSKFEEVNRIIKGGFYGWPTVEGKKTNQDLPSEYVDPVFQYGHANFYCGIVGGTFYYPDHPQFPPEYTGRYFYSDYCTGHIRMLEVETGLDRGIFIEDGDRVVDLMVVPHGSLYYLERQGRGDGTFEDNTATNEGALWKVSYTGAGTPFISVQPESILVSEGEAAEFNVNATGALPLTYTWWLNGIEVDSNNKPMLQIENASLALDSAGVVVDVSNEFGLAVSGTVLLRVTGNHRPEPIILTPPADLLYEAGDTLFFSGSAYDDEDGFLSAPAFSWKIDFHHGVHSHPGMSWTTGVLNDNWIIPSFGETSSEVWYRIYLKVVDNQGLAKVVYRDIFPALGIIQVSSSPTGLQINLDGTPVPAPFSIEGVKGMSRYISAPQKQVLGDSIYFFEKWNDGNREHTRLVATSQDDQAFTGVFKGFPKGHGVGLTARYFSNADLAGNPVFTEIDSLIDHQFHFNAPNSFVPADYFSIRWDGFIQAYKSGEYKFTVFADDGIIVEIDDMPVIEEWNPGVHNLSGSRYLQQGRFYPVRISLFDHQYHSQIKLRWSSPDFKEEVVPSAQLYPENYFSNKYASGILNVKSISSNTLELWSEAHEDSMLDLTVVSVSGLSYPFLNHHIPAGKHVTTLDIAHLLPGIYFLTSQDRSTGEKEAIRFVKVK